MTIYKYNLGVNGESATIKGKIRKILKVGFQPGEGVVCWCEVDDRCEEVSIKIVCVGTGWDPLPEEINYMDYIGTAQDGLGYVWHYYATPFTNPYAFKSKFIVDDDIFDTFFGVGVN